MKNDKAKLFSVFVSLLALNATFAPQLPARRAALRTEAPRRAARRIACQN
jgi:hypothetical protein